MAARRDAWWSYARGLQQMSESARRATVPNGEVRAHLARIARLPPAIGETLDKQKAPLRVYKFVAYAPVSAAMPLQLSQKARFDAILAFVVRTSRWPLPRQMQEVDLAVRTKWSGVGASKMAPSPPLMASPPASAVTPTRPAVSAPMNILGALTAPVSPALPASLAQAVASQDPELAALLRQIAANRTGLGP